MLNGTYYGWMFLIALPLFLSPSVVVRMDIWQRLLAAKNEKTAKQMSLFSGLGMLPFYIIFPLVGMAVRVVIGGGLAPKDVTYIFVERHTGSFLLGFAVVGLLSALMSSGDSFLNLISISFVNDFIKSKKTSSYKKKFQIRLYTILFGFIALVMALIFPKIVDLMVVGIGTIVIFVPATIFALTHNNVLGYNKIAFWSILCGFLVNIIFFVGGFLIEILDPKSSFIPAFVTALLVLFIGVRFKKKMK
jgi:Na+/proline symporter